MWLIGSFGRRTKAEVNENDFKKFRNRISRSQKIEAYY